jgi:hypothetical protein
MAKKHEAKAKPTGGVPTSEARFDMKLDLTDDREREVSEFLASFKGKREASRMVKQILFERKTGLDWYTGRPLHNPLVAAPVAGTALRAEAAERATATPVIFNPDDLDALDEDLGDWGGSR